ncbi:MAG: peptide-methionine (R)-S-oxide reductase MsrB [Candidatus Verstraetearchaeota archaeon]|nr:peptide-methionine (R)-S-oxide reductase MsrB [Candidatus Verstraetearchaeota archaeon]
MKVKKTEDEWRRSLTAEQYRILRMGETEMPFTGKLLHNKETGVYRCAGCGNPLFLSTEKFDSGSGWPSFMDAIEGSLEYFRDTSHGMDRVEVRCSRCGGHLGHVFDDGPPPKGKRYCINSAAMEFERRENRG